MRLRRIGKLGAVGSMVGGATLAAMGAWPGCSIYNSSLLLDGGDDADAAEASAPCFARWPPLPAHDDPASGSNYSGFVVMQSVDVGSMDGGAALLESGVPLPPIGFDLDNDCTCCTEPKGGTCTTGGSCVGQSVICDDKAGRDHVALNIFQVIPNASAAANAGMQAGQFSMLLQIGGYNGTPNDTNVTVALYVSNGMDGIQDGGPVTPRHDGTDRWTVDTHYLATTQAGGTVSDGTDCNVVNACQPIYVDNSAYVSSGVLVARPSATLPLTFGYRANIGGALMKLNDTVISGTLNPIKGDGGNTTWGMVNGSISGRWESAQLLSNLASLPNPNVDGSFLCGTDPAAASLYQSVKAYVCSIQDIAAHQALDNTMATCDALSMSFGFKAEPALLGTVYSVNQPMSGCATDAGLWSDKCQ